MNYLSTAMAGVRVGLSSTSGARLALPFSSPLPGVGRIASVEVGAVRHMAVPKKKVSVQKRRVRRFHNKFNGGRKMKNMWGFSEHSGFNLCVSCGSHKVRHYACPGCGYVNKKHGVVVANPVENMLLREPRFPKKKKAEWEMSE
eukprot:TRINITY_DN4447_c0_g1_i1.p1 TRINITY_DN4447_c0_g1~~TRINITY_DN4447_c0_g1_i1.p1  ORF type:complete len:144 (+),score=17.36 TRINITY_DN4447_c0_g1_i1:148-579(+)